MMALRNVKMKWKCPGVSKIRKGYLYKILVIGIVLLSCVYLIDFTTSHLDEISQYTKLLQRPTKEEDYSNEVDEIVDENYFVKTPGCRIVKMDVMNEQIRSFFPSSERDKPKPIRCGPPALTDSDEKYLWINLTEVELKKFYNISSPDHLQCYFTTFTRLTDYSVIKNETINPLHFGQRSKIDSEYVQVFCENGNQSQLYIDFHTFFVVPSKQIDDKVEEKVEKYNVMILGVDSMSKLNFHRMLNVTSKTILEDLEAIEMQGYNKVGDNTYPNLIPMLTNLSEEELNGACLSSNASIYFDNCHFIWDEFKRKGFGTLFSEDSATLSLFNYFKNGFEKQPVDYYFRTMMHQMEKDIAYNKIGNYKLCLGSQRPVDVLFKYIKKFVKSMADQLFFSFFWTSSMTHDFINYPMLIDKDLSQLLLHMKDEKYLEKTVLFVLSDHGLRFGSFRQTTFQGMVEERLPFFFAIFPKSFKQNYPLAVKNLKRNSRRLTTHFDVFETLKDLSNLDANVLSNEKLRKRSSDLSERESALPRGISLFLEIPVERTCESAGIESHWCMCYEKIELSNSDHRVQKAARFVVKTMNDLIRGLKTCHFLYLNSIISAHMHVLNEHVFTSPPNRDKIKSLRPPKTRKKIYDITLKITTKPGPRPEFEATVRQDEINDEIKLTGTISRISTYTKGCVKDSFIEKYCFCDPI